jgi:hypothetical protein
MQRRASEPSRSSVRRSLLILVLIVRLFSAPESAGLGISISRSPRERSVGIDRPAASFVFGAPVAGSRATRWRIEVGQWDLFGIDGVYGTTISIELEGRNERAVIRAGRVSTSVGSETELGLGVLASVGGGLWAGSSCAVEVVQIDECRASYMILASPCAMVRATPNLALIAVIEDARVAGEKISGAGGSLSLVAGAERALCVSVSVAAAREGSFHLGGSSRLLLGRDAILILGYQEVTGAFEGSLAIRLRSVFVEAGATAHPFLGVSKSLFLSWGRGW